MAKYRLISQCHVVWGPGSKMQCSAPSVFFSSWLFPHYRGYIVFSVQSAPQRQTADVCMHMSFTQTPSGGPSHRRILVRATHTPHRRLRDISDATRPARPSRRSSYLPSYTGRWHDGLSMLLLLLLMSLLLVLFLVVVVSAIGIWMHDACS